MLDLENVRVVLGRERNRPVLDEVSLKLGPEKVVILGPNGSGKTTLIRVILGLVKPLKGRVSVNGMDVSGVRNMIGVTTNLPEVYRMIGLPVSDLVRLYCEMTDGDYDSIISNLREMGFGNVLHRKLYNLSTGEQKIVCNILSLWLDPFLALLDEPFDNLDQASRIRMMNLLRDMKCSVLINTHELDIIPRLEGWKLYLMLEGKLYGPFSVSQLDNLYLSKGKIPDSISVIENSMGIFSITEGHGQVPISRVRNLNSILDEVI